MHFVLGTNGPKGVILTDGSLWLEHRRFAIHVLRDFGLGKNLMQERILDEFLAMSTKLDATIQASSDNNNNDDDEAKEAEKEIDLARSFIDPAIGSIINNLLFGYRFDGVRFGAFKKYKKMYRN
jgi:cytochrome P450 family 33